jgi:hypothetical protein
VTVIDTYTAGDPMQDGVFWTNLSRPEIAARLSEQGYDVSVTVVDQLCEQFHLGYHKPQKVKTTRECTDRDEQFRHIEELKERYREAGRPILSMDTKAREMLGQFARRGRLLSTAPLQALDHDFPSLSTGVVIPHGLYDLQLNEGYMHLGISHDTSEFAADTVQEWWRHYGGQRYPNADALLLLCDSGGSNGCRRLGFKEELQRVAESTGLVIRVAHYPTGCSKYNPIDHRLFPHLTRACQGVFLTALEQVRDLMRKATTKTGLRVYARCLRQIYETGRQASVQCAEQLNIYLDRLLPLWNYVLLPSKLNAGEVI